MRFSPPEEAVVLYETAFTHDLLDRKKVGQALSDLLERIEDPLAVVLDGGWGAGKSYFLQRWVGAHNLQFGGSATTVYFDAFAHDYLEDPLVALIGALSERLPPEKKPTMDKVKSLAWRLLRPAARVGLSLATFGATQALGDVGDVVAEAVGGETKEALNSFWEREEGRRAAMAEFRAAVSSLMEPAADSSTGTPLVIVVDELDRCRPDYALQILEIIKHFFSVPKLHFVLGVNLKALENSVKARYGADIDATLYLQKFINITFSLPETVGGQNEDVAAVIFARDLAKRMGIPSKITNALAEHLQLVSMSNWVSMRDICRILSSVALLPRDVFEKEYLSGWIEVMLTLVVSREIRPDLYPKFRKPSVNAKDIASYFGSSPDVIAEEGPGGEANPRYNHDAFWRHHAWLYLVQDGRVENQAVLKGIESLFFVGFSRGQPSSIPGRITRNWLDLFTAR